MKAKLLKEQMGVPAGTEMEVLETGRAWTLKAPSGAEIVVPSCDVEMVPDTEPLSEPKPEVELGSTMEYGTGSGYLPPPEPEVDPKDPSLLVNIFGGQPQPEAERTLLDDERDVEAFPEVAPSDDAAPLEESQGIDAIRDSEDNDLDEPLPEQQDPCEGESCESCQ